MNREYLSRMSAAELKDYMETLGIDAPGAKTAKARVEAIERRHERTAEVEALGIPLTIPMKRLRDKRVTDIVGASNLTDEDAERLIELILGPEQMETVIEAVTDEDGTVDNESLAYVIKRILTSDELKNS